MPLPMRHRGQLLWETRLHAIPREVDAGMVFQIPVDACGDIDPGVSPDHNTGAALVELEKVAVGLDQLCLELP